MSGVVAIGDMAIVIVHGHVSDHFLGSAPRVPVLPVEKCLSNDKVVIIAENYTNFACE